MTWQSLAGAGSMPMAAAGRPWAIRWMPGSGARPRARDDTVIRRRLRQKMEFISEDVAPPAEPTEAELRTFLDEHADRFGAPWQASFAQV